LKHRASLLGQLAFSGKKINSSRDLPLPEEVSDSQIECAGVPTTN